MSPLRRSVRQDFRMYERRLGPAKLYLDDVEDIVRSLREALDEAKELAREEAEQGFKERIKSIERSMGSERSISASRSGNRDELDRKRSELLANLQKSMQESLTKDEAHLEKLYRVEIKASDAVADEVDDLRSCTKQDLNRVRITTYRPHVAIMFARTGARVLTIAEGEGEEREARLLVDDIANFINKRRRRFPTRLSMLTVFALALSLFALLIVILAAVTNEGVSKLASLPIVVAVGPLSLVVDQIAAYRFGSVTVIPERRSERRGLSASSRRNATIAVVSAAVGAILGTIGTFLLEKLTK